MTCADIGHHTPDAINCLLCPDGTQVAGSRMACDTCGDGFAGTAGLCYQCTAGQAPNLFRTACESCTAVEAASNNSARLFSPTGTECATCASPNVVDANRTSCTTCAPGTGPDPDGDGLLELLDQTTCSACIDIYYSERGECTPCYAPNIPIRARR